MLTSTDYQQQLADKITHLQHIMADFTIPTLEIFPSAGQHYRMRAEFRLWHQDDDIYHVMFDANSKRPVRVDQFPAASQLINQLMPVVLAHLKQSPLLRERLFQIDYLTTTRQQALITLLYHRPLDQQWQQQASELQQQLRQQGFDVHLIGRARKTKICLQQDYLDECLEVAGQSLIYRQVENSFTQPNAQINQQMLNWAVAVTTGSQGDLLELYCGNGNFSLALAKNFRRVLATEIASSSVAAAQYNIQANQLDNVTILRMSAEEFSQALNQVRPFRRLANIDLTNYQCDTILVDPPRSGLDQYTLNLVQGYRHILYVSCNPHTLAANLQQLSHSHTIERFALFDQFPYTPHLESAVYLSRTEQQP